MLFKFFENTCSWKSVVKICVMLRCLKHKNCCLNTPIKYPLNVKEFRFDFLFKANLDPIHICFYFLCENL